ncbi:GDP-mannose mannosyl hydrolase [Edwardsiella tarda]|uniref:GDP-mannose mannosyl hydrolase n=1 Tax=Edwardsiella tarda TaxID=636 RepID=UPI00351C1A9C
MSRRLNSSLFKTIIANTPLVSIDLIVRNQDGKALLGQRLNRPAQGYWFVPGGRIRKDESFTQAFSRLTHEELGIMLTLPDAQFIGAYQHFYSDNAFNADFSTHYVVLAYQLMVNEPIWALPLEQHGRYRWFDVDELLITNNVHQNTKDYFI